MFDVTSAVSECELLLVKSTSDRLLSQIYLMVNPGFDSTAWDKESNYMSSSRVTYGISSWVTYYCNLANDFRLFSESINKGGDEKQRLLCREVFAHALKEGMRAAKTRYFASNVSRAMLPQWKTDVVVILKFAALFLEKLKTSMAAPKLDTNAWLSDDEDEGDKVRYMMSSDSDCLKAIMSYVRETEADCNLLMWHLAIVCGDATEVVTYCEEIIRPEDHLTPKTMGRRSSSYEKLSDFGFDKLIEGPMLMAMFAPQKILMSSGKEKKIKVSLVNSIITGGPEETTFFKKISTLKLPWSRSLEYSVKRRTKKDIADSIKKRHEVGDWKYPELTSEEENARREIVDVMNRCN